MLLSNRALANRLAALVPSRHVPFLVIRLAELPQLAWKRGRTAALRLERRARRAFAEIASSGLRGSDLAAHDPRSDLFSIALAGVRSDGSIALPGDCRATLSRMVGGLERTVPTRFETGWTVVTSVEDPRLHAEMRTALDRGLRERERYDFFSTVGHELRTPITSIRGYLETLIESPPDGPSSRRFLRVARDETLRLSRLVDGMFEISLLDLAGTRPVSPAPTTSSAPVVALRAACEALEPRAIARFVTIAAGPIPEGAVSIERDRLVQIFANVIANAVDHGREGGTIAISGTALDARSLVICVDDDGPGIPEEERETIFEIGYRGRFAIADGTGLGLPLVRRLVERAGGSVTASQAPAGGTRIALRFLLATAS